MEELIVALTDVADELRTGYSDSFDRRVADVLERVALKLEQAKHCGDAAVSKTA